MAEDIILYNEESIHDFRVLVLPCMIVIHHAVATTLYILTQFWCYSSIHLISCKDNYNVFMDIDYYNLMHDIF